MIRGLLEMYVENTRDYKVEASIGCAENALDVCRERRIDVILMDVLTDDGASGLTATAKIKETFPNIRILVVTSLLDEDVLAKAKAVGADSLWYKDVSQDELMEVVRRTVEGERVFPDAPPQVAIGQVTNYDFTRKEKEVLRYLIRGLSYPEIAQEMDLSVATIKYHVTNMLQKTGCRDKLMLALEVQNAKIIVNGF